MRNAFNVHIINGDKNLDNNSIKTVSRMRDFFMLFLTSLRNFWIYDSVDLNYFSEINFL